MILPKEDPQGVRGCREHHGRRERRSRFGRCVGQLDGRSVASVSPRRWHSENDFRHRVHRQARV